MIGPSISRGGPVVRGLRERLRRGLGPAVAILPAAVFLVSSLSADMVAIRGRDVLGLWQVLPAGPVGGSWVNAEVSSTGLLIIAISLWRAKRVGFVLAIAVLAAAVVVQGALHHHPIAAATALLTAILLIATRRRYIVRTGAFELRLAALLLGLGASLVVVDALSSPGGLFRHGAALLGSWADLGSIGRFSLTSGLTVLLVAARVAFLAAAAMTLEPAADPRAEATRAAARSALARLGRGALLPYQRGPLAEPFATRAGDGVLAYARAGRTAIVLGEPSGPAGRPDEPAALAAFDAWVDQCRALDWEPAVYQASDAFRALLIDRGWHAIRVGSEAVLDPASFDLSSPRLANVRHTVSRARRGGLRATCSSPGIALPAGTSIRAMSALDEAWRRANGPSLGFTVGEFDPATLAGCLVVAALDPQNDLVAFVVLRPTGTDRGWMLDLMRRRRGGVPGGMELCLVTAIEALRARGVRRLSLGLAPLAGLSTRRGPLAERLLAVVASLLRPVYDVGGLAFYKDKFAPEWEARHLVVRHRAGFPGAALALVWLHLGGTWRRVLRSVGAPVTDLAHRFATVATDRDPRRRGH